MDGYFHAQSDQNVARKSFDWGQITGLFRPQKVTEWTVPEAFLGVLGAAATCDGILSPEEQDEILALARRSRALKSLGADELRRVNVVVSERLGKRPDKALAEACDSLPADMRLSVFAHVLDVVLADGELVAEEADFLNRLTHLLELDIADVQRVAEVIALKNKY